MEKFILTLAHSYLSWFYYFSQGFWGGLGFFVVLFLFFGANCVQEPQVGANILRVVEISKIFFFFSVLLVQFIGACFWF